VRWTFVRDFFAKTVGSFTRVLIRHIFSSLHLLFRGPVPGGRRFLRGNSVGGNIVSGDVTIEASHPLRKRHSGRMNYLERRKPAGITEHLPRVNKNARSGPLEGPGVTSNFTRHSGSHHFRRNCSREYSRQRFSMPVSLNLCL
jgi:hypothetical protein